MYYIINVNLNGHNLFSTHEKSIQHIGRLKNVYRLFKEKFPESEGFNLTIDKIQEVKNEIELEEEIKELKEIYNQS
jgi:hypothetical protein